MLHAVIMAGGAGTRFWPASTRDVPKQLLRLVGRRTMIQATVDRLGELVSPQRTMVVTGARLARRIAEQLPELPPEAIIAEPCKRDTAPCIALAAALLVADDPQATMIVMPADHVIPDAETFQAAAGSAVALVDERPERLVTFGICPTYPAETFGYIERGERLKESADDESGPAVFEVRQFREKPERAVAEAYLASGRFYWNSGIFVWRAARILELLQQHEPAMYQHLATIAAAAGARDYQQVLEREFTAIEAKSIDYAVMERADEVVVVEAPFAWDDVGNWQALPRLHGTDDEDNTVIGRHVGLNTTGSIICGDDDHLIATLGAKDLIIVHTPRATLVARKQDEESIRELVKWIEADGLGEYL